MTTYLFAMTGLILLYNVSNMSLGASLVKRAMIHYHSLYIILHYIQTQDTSAVLTRVVGPLLSVGETDINSVILTVLNVTMKMIKLDNRDARELLVT